MQSFPRRSPAVAIALAQISQRFQISGAMIRLALYNTLEKSSPTRSVSLEASLSTGMMNRKKKIERIANPFAVRAYILYYQYVSSKIWQGSAKAYDDSVVPGEDSKLIKSSDQIPPRSDVAGYEDRKSENREGVHESPIAGASLFCRYSVSDVWNAAGKNSFRLAARQLRCLWFAVRESCLCLGRRICDG